MKIKKYQSGGPTYIATSNRREVAEPATSSSDSASKVPGFAKEIIDLVKENGLNNDVTTFLSQMTNILNLAEDPTGENISMRQIMQAQVLANQVKVNYEDYKKARESLNTQNAWGEMATDKRGYLYVQNQETKKLETVSHSDYTKNQDKYIALTNEDVLNLRRDDPSLSYRTDILDNISSAVGMKTITDYAKALIQEFGTTSITGYSEKQASKIRSGLEHIVAGDAGDFRGILTQGPDGIYKISSEATIVDTGIKEALNYLVSTMPRSYQNTLSAKATVEGYSPDAMLMQMMYYNTDRKLSVDYDNQVSKVYGYTNGDSGTEALTNDNLAIRFLKGDLTETTAYISPVAQLVGDKAQMAIQAWNGGRPQRENGEHLYKNNLQDLLTNTFQLAGVEFTDLSFANQAITGNDLSGLVWDGESSVNRVALPYKIVNGKKVPDFDVLSAINEINAKIKDNPGLTQLEINEEYEKLRDYGVVPDPNTPGRFTFDPSRIAFFATIGAYGSKDILKLEEQSKNYVERLPKNRGKLMTQEFNNLVRFGKPIHTKNEKPKNDLPESSSGDFYHGNLYIAITDPMLAVNTTKDQYVPKSEYMNVNQKYILGNQIQSGAQNSSWTTNF